MRRTMNALELQALVTSDITGSRLWLSHDGLEEETKWNYLLVMRKVVRSESLMSAQVLGMQQFIHGSVVELTDHGIQAREHLVKAQV